MTELAVQPLNVAMGNGRISRETNGQCSYDDLRTLWHQGDEQSIEEHMHVVGVFLTGMRLYEAFKTRTCCPWFGTDRGGLVIFTMAWPAQWTLLGRLRAGFCSCKANQKVRLIGIEVILCLFACPLEGGLSEMVF